MKLVLTSQGASMQSLLDSRFGRAPYILIVDTDTKDFKVIDNNLNVGSTTERMSCRDTPT